MHVQWPGDPVLREHSTCVPLSLQVGKGMPKKYGIEGDLREALYR
jgi:hypothetical protein